MLITQNSGQFPQKCWLLFIKSCHCKIINHKIINHFIQLILGKLSYIDTSTKKKTQFKTNGDLVNKMSD